MPPSSLQQRFGSVALVTGASDGIGKAMAERLAAAGLDLVLSARRADLLEKMARDLAARHAVQVRTVPADLSQPDGIERLLAGASDVEVGLLVAAAGFGSSGAFLAGDLVAEQQMVDVNCRAVVTLAHHLAGPMARRGRGGIVLFGSLLGFQGAPGSATYAATKAFNQSFAEGLRAELAPRGVRVLAVAPGPVASGFGARAGMALGGGASPDAVASAIVAALDRRWAGGTLRPGAGSKALGWSLGLLPRPIRVRAIGRVMRGLSTEPSR